MKRLVAALLLCALPGTALAASGGDATLPPGFFDDFLGPDTVPLTAKERRALNLTRDWAGRGPAPVLSQSGKLVYVHGASLPTIIASPMQVCDVELQPGEKVNEIVVGDSARWMVESGTAGDTTHLFVKPVDAGLETTAVVTTDRRVYHLRLISQRTGHTPYVGFVYSDAMKKKLAESREAQVKERERNAL
ncbi:TrbG/VirB9 family P-type conjugative transfer protein, partial [Desulfovibrio piger]|nr:TrbG/VirB9 family P-type conjugative transfer protein [Desulfovibrio piger]